MPAQYTSFNPYQQLAQQEAMQAEYARQQQEWQLQQQQAQLQAQQQQQQEEWMRQQQFLQLQQQQQQMQVPQQPLTAQPTGFGTNNPFAPALTASSSNASSAFSSPALQNSTPISFNLQGTYANGNAPSSFTPPPQPPKSAPPGPGSMRNPTKTDQEHAHLADLFANRDDGIDSFGNFGQLRYGQQAGRLVGQQTGQPGGHNPFAQQQQQQQQQQQVGNDQPFFSI
ncbi:hypothetical protein EIP91_010517 [Steccherinum ochraceum]|uniref:Uncharacterized protein n=1 Tax=Steccherinum ochraceum TaxID=92696 RepID=A0A4R0R0I6_9APHY|nr:hypothetical protein EIP91_010517 [Steccherinum ochraceum]